MAVFAPVYRPTRGQQSFHTHRLKNERKRKREQDSSTQDEDVASQDSSDGDLTTRVPNTTSRHVNRTDPYYVAGATRQDVLPPPPFPHAAVALAGGRSKSVNVNQELAALKPAVFLASDGTTEHSASLKRRHIDNLTAILHSCVLKGDWQRASRAWGLLLRTEIGGQGMDVRQNGRWGLAAELLMRHGADTRRFQHREDSDDSSVSQSDENRNSDRPTFTDEGLQLAREYYERLILQYPHTPHSQHSINALVFYPALFNIWIYGTQDRYRRLRRVAVNAPVVSPTASEDSNDVHTPSSCSGDVSAIAQQELDEALRIAVRMDEVMQGPPYDASLPLLRMRGMLGLWLADLCVGQGKAKAEDDSELSDISDSKDPPETKQAREHRSRALRAFVKVKRAGEELPAEIIELIEQEGS